jgi:iduronate 2-sulfatase
LRSRNSRREKGEKWLPAFEASDEPVESYQGYKIAQKAIEELRLSKETQQPAFITVGFTKPHLPFNCPKKYWDLYPASSISLPDNYEKAKDIPNQLVNATDVELKRGYTNIPNDKNPLSEELAIELIRGYYACVSFTDDMIGLIFEAMDEEGFWENTIVVLTSDHGYQLGDHGVWCKHSLYDTSLRSPLIVSVPGMKGNQRTEALVEYVDLYPTLCDLAGLPKPTHLEGKSFAPLFANPTKPWDEPVFSRWLNGDSIKTQRYLYSQWRNKQGKVIANSLFDHIDDPDENNNLATKPESKAIISKLSAKLNAFVEQNEKE